MNTLKQHNITNTKFKLKQFSSLCFLIIFFLFEPINSRFGKMETDNLSNDSQIPDSILCDSNKFPTNSVNEEKTSQIEIENNNIDDENDENVEMTISTNVNNKKGKVQNKTMEATEVRPCQFALGRIKSIMKMDPEMGLSSKESVFLIAKATVNFIIFFC